MKKNCAPDSHVPGKPASGATPTHSKTPPGWNVKPTHNSLPGSVKNAPPPDRGMKKGGY